MTILLKAWLFSLVIIIFLSSRFLLTINSCYCRYSLFAFRLGPAGLIRLNSFWSTWVIFIIRCFLSPPSGWSKMFFFVFQLIINIRWLSYSRFPILLLIFVRICLDFTPLILLFLFSFFNIFSYFFPPDGCSFLIEKHVLWFSGSYVCMNTFYIMHFT